MQRFRCTSTYEAVQWKGDNEAEIKEFSDYLLIRHGNSPISLIKRHDDRLDVDITEIQIDFHNDPNYPQLVKRGQWLVINPEKQLLIVDGMKFEFSFEPYTPPPEPKPQPTQFEVELAKFPNGKAPNFLLEIAKGNTVCDCDQCGKEWLIPKHWKKSYSPAKFQNMRGRKAKITCVDCREQNAIIRHQRYKYVPENNEIKEDIKRVIDTGERDDYTL